MNQWLTTPRLLAGVGLAFCIVCILKGAIFITQSVFVTAQQDSGSIVGVITDLSTEKESESSDSGFLSLEWADVELPNGTTVRVTIEPPPEPQMGDEVPMLWEWVGEDMIYYHLDEDAWQAKAAGSAGADTGH